MGGKSAKMWTYLILFFVTIVAILIANFALSNPEVIRNLGSEPLATRYGFAVSDFFTYFINFNVLPVHS